MSFSNGNGRDDAQRKKRIDELKRQADASRLITQVPSRVTVAACRAPVFSHNSSAIVGR